MNGLPAVLIGAFGLVLVVGRILHAVGLLVAKAHWARVLGMGMTIAVISIEAATCVGLFIFQA